MPLAGGPLRLESCASVRSRGGLRESPWTDFQAGTITKVPTGGGAPVLIAKSVSNPRCLALDATTVYWTDMCPEGAEVIARMRDREVPEIVGLRQHSPKGGRRDGRCRPESGGLGVRRRRRA
jgi:hypothetical protein